MSDESACLIFVKRTVEIENTGVRTDGNIAREYVIDVFVASIRLCREII